MRFTQVDDWLRWMETQHPRAIDLGLERVALVASRLGITLKMPVITVAGTNGKGSCVALISAILGADGYRVGAYTSPHINQYHERIVIAGERVDDGSLCVAFTAIDEARGDTSLTYFEFGTLAALLVFQQQAVDVAVLEVGLGGRLDAVNIIDADVAIVTSVSIDHEEWLGHDREAIGREKAGVFRSDRPAIIGEILPPKSVLDYGSEIGARLVCRGDHFDVRQNVNNWAWRGQAANGDPISYEDLPRPVIFIDNAASVLQALQYVGLPVSYAAIKQGMTTVKVAGRCQHIQYRGVDVVLDVAHNPASVRILAEHLVANPVSGRTECLFAVMADKAIAEIVAVLIPHFDHWNLVPLADNARAASADSVGELLQFLNVDSLTVATSFAGGMDKAMSRLSVGDRLVVFGSFFTVAAAMAELAELIGVE